MPRKRRTLRTHTVMMSDSAFADVTEIGDYIARSIPENARAFVQTLMDAIDRLATMPELHAPAPEGIVNGILTRHLIVGKYRVIFTVESDRVHVHEVRHGARLPRRR